MLELILMAAAGALPIDSGWSRAPTWDDGLAEVAVYDARRRIYGRERSFETVMITVKEDFSRALWVKADPPYEAKELLTVLKVNLVSRIPTENYPYSYMTSIFVARDDPRRLIKLSHSSQEWCGTTFKEVVTWDGPAYMLFHSYFDGQGDGRHSLDLDGGALLEEQLFVALRAERLEPGVPVPLRLYDAQVTNAAGPPGVRPASALLAGEETVHLPAGPADARRVEIRAGGGTAPLMTFWIGRGPDRVLVKFEASDGRSMRLKEIARRDYWSR